jgi:hypothetical protein
MKKLVLLGCCVMLLAVPSAGAAQGIAFGPQVSWADDTDFGVGARLVFGLSDLYPNLEAIISGDYFFWDACDDCTYIEVNANVALPINVEAALNPYVGGGLNIARVSVDFGEFGGSASDTEVGLNVLGGLKFPGDSFTPFVEARFEIGGGEQFVLTGGILLGGRR